MFYLFLLFALSSFLQSLNFTNKRKNKNNLTRLITVIASHLYSIFILILFSPSAFRSHRSTVLSNNPSRETTGNIFSHLTGIISSIPTSTSPSSHHACNNRLSVVPSNLGSSHNTSGNNSITQLSSPLSSDNTPLRELLSAATETATAQINQQCQTKSLLLINHKSNDDNFGKNSSQEIRLYQQEETQEKTWKQDNHNSSNVETNANDLSKTHENGLITIVTINDLSVETTNSIV